MEASQTEGFSSLNDDLSGIIGEYSIPHMTEMSSESLLTQSQYAKVIFHDIADTYSTDADVCCRYTLTSGVTPVHGDRIALFRVGWSSVMEYEVFEFVPEPDSQNREQREFQVLFKARNLPKDVREFYQLCYVTASDNVCGASVPFQFRHLQDEDLCVVEGPEGMAVVRTRTALAEERLRLESEARGREKCEAEKKLRDMEDNYGTVTRELQAALQSVSKLETEKKVMEAKLSDLNHVDLLLVSLKKDYESLDVEKNEACIKQQKAELRVQVLNETIKELTLDKDHLTNLLRAEASQNVDVAQYRSQADSLQAMLEALSQSKEMVAQELRLEQEAGKQLRESLEHSKSEISRLDKLVQDLNSEQQNLQFVLDETLKEKPSFGADSPGTKMEEQDARLEEIRQENEHLLAQLTLAASDKEELCRLRNVLKERNRALVSIQGQLNTCHSALCSKAVENDLMQRNLMMDGARQAETRLGREEELMMLMLQHERSLWEMRNGAAQTKTGKGNGSAEEAGFKIAGVKEQLAVTVKRINELEKVKGQVQKSLESRGGDTACILEEQRKAVNKRFAKVSKMQKDIAECEFKVNSLYDEIHAIMLEQEQVGTNAAALEKDMWILKFGQKSSELQSFVGQLHALQDRLREYNQKKERGFKDVPKTHMVVDVQQILLARKIVLLDFEQEEVVKHKENLEKVLREEKSKQEFINATINDLRCKINFLENELAESKKSRVEEKSQWEVTLAAIVGEQEKISAKKISELQREFADVKKALENENYKKSESDSKALDEQRKIFAKRINELERELTEVRKALEQERSKKTTKDKVRDQLASVQAKKVSLEEEVRETTSSIAELVERASVVEGRLVEVTVERHQMEAELRQARTTLGTCRDQLAALQKHVAFQEHRLRSELGTSAAADMGYAGSELCRARTEITHMEAFVESSHMRARDLQDKLEELVQERGVLEQQFQQAKEGKAEREAARCELMDRLSHTEAEIMKLMETGHQQDWLATSMLEDLKRRLKLASLEYQKLYQEKQKVERRLAKMMHRKGAGSASPLATPPAEPVMEPAGLQDLVLLTEESGTNRDIVAKPVATGGPDFCFVCPFCAVTFQPGAYDLFTHHFDNHLC